jgi:hypothetical protein
MWQEPDLQPPAQPLTEAARALPITSCGSVYSVCAKLKKKRHHRDVSAELFRPGTIIRSDVGRHCKDEQGASHANQGTQMRDSAEKYPEF